MQNLSRAFVILALLTIAGPADAGIVFDLRADAIEDIDEASSFTLSDPSGLTATISANMGVLNRTASGFGINAPLVGDVTDNIDGANGVEIVSITFNFPVTFDAMTLSLYSLGTQVPIEDIGALTIGANPTIFPKATASANDVYQFNTNNFVNTGESVQLAWVQGNGFSFNNFTVEFVPEPSTLCMWGIGCVAFGAWFHRRRWRCL